MNSEKTAISRKTASRPTKDILKRGGIVGRVLDYGCGKGMDSKFLLSEGFEVLSYDPYYEPMDLTNAGKFDTIICNYVINVIEGVDKRTELIEKLLSFLNVGGKLYITARSKKEVDTNAKASNWKRHRDGYITGKNTFQKGITDNDFGSCLMASKWWATQCTKHSFISTYKSTVKYSILAIQRNI